MKTLIESDPSVTVAFPPEALEPQVETYFIITIPEPPAPQADPPPPVLAHPASLGAVPPPSAPPVPLEYPPPPPEKYLPGFGPGVP